MQSSPEATGKGWGYGGTAVHTLANTPEESFSAHAVPEEY